MTQKYPPLPILLVDDEELILAGLEAILNSHGLTNILCCTSSVEAVEKVRRLELELVLLDLLMPEISGEEVLSTILAEKPNVPAIIVTGLDEVDNAVRCMRLGAFDYLVKPLDENRLLGTVNRALEVCRLRRQNELLRRKVLSDELEKPEAFREIITASRAMFSIFQYCEAIAYGREPVLITGETGVGKELVSNALHKLGREQEPFVALNVAGLDNFMFSDTLFGHVRGAYTGANVSRAGLVEAAGHGTRFLDEIGDLSEASQVKLLRLLQEREYRPLGSDTNKSLRARVVASTHRDLEANPNSIRRDLYYRLRTHHIRIPPLRERLEDIPPPSRAFPRTSQRGVRPETSRSPSCRAGHALGIPVPWECPRAAGCGFRRPGALP